MENYPKYIPFEGIKYIFNNKDIWFVGCVDIISSQESEKQYNTARKVINDYSNLIHWHKNKKEGLFKILNKIENSDVDKKIYAQMEKLGEDFTLDKVNNFISKMDEVIEIIHK